MRKALFVTVSLAAVLCIGAGCQLQHSPHVYNPFHWGRHISHVFSPRDGELHHLHLDLDRVVFGVENYEEFSDTEYVYSE